MRSGPALRQRLTYANVMDTVAVFVALGGGACAAVNLPRNSVGQKQLRTGSVGRSELHKASVGPSELRNGAVRSRAVRDRSLRVRDLSTGAREALRGEQGPPGAPGAAGTAFHAVITGGGDPASGNATGIQHAAGCNEYVVRFAGDLSACAATATLGSTASAAGAAPPAGRITVALAQGAAVVRTYDAGGARHRRVSTSWLRVDHWP